MKTLSSYNPRYIELLILLLIIILLSFVSISVAGLMTLGFIWNWTLRFEIEKVKTNKRYRFSTLKLVFALDQLLQMPFRSIPQAGTFLRLLPAGLFWLLIGWFLGSLDFWWAPFMGSALYEMIHLLLKKMMAPVCE